MKSPLKPGKYKTLIGNEAYVLQLPTGVHFKDPLHFKIIDVL